MSARLGKREAARRIWPYLKPHLGTVIVSMVLSIPMAAIAFVGAPAVKFLTDEVLAKKSYANLRWLVIMIVAGSLVNFVVRFLNNYLIRSAANRMTQALRNDLYAHILRLSAGYFSEAQGGALVSRVLNDVQLISRAVTSLVEIVREPLSFIALLAYAFYLNWSLTLITLIMIPACAILLSNTGKHSKRYSGRINDKLGDMSALLMESISGMRVIQAFRLERYLRSQFMKINRDFTRTALKAVRSEELSRPAVDLLFGLSIAILFFYAGREALKDRMSAGDVVAFFLAFGLIVNPLKKISELSISLNQASAAVDTIFRILAIRSEVSDRPGATALPAFSRDIEFRNVTFRYQKEGTRQLKDFSLKIKKGEVIALVGASGAGKSTVLSLIPRFYDPEAGEIFVDGQNIRDVRIDSLRSQISLVTQEVFLFHDTIRANIRAGRHEVSDERLMAAAEAAQAWAFIERMPAGLNSVIGDRGQKLSGGERQRLSIARAILKDAPILLLDEATSALDSENERLVQAALDRLLVGRTAIVVAHRLSTVRKADRILVMEKGQIIEEGTHEELLARGGAYKRALSHQEGFPL